MEDARQERSRQDGCRAKKLTAMMLHLKAIHLATYTPGQEPGSVFAQVSTYPTRAPAQMPA